MKDVFVSRPTWVAKPFEPGLNNFLGHLEEFELRPRTLGVTDHPARAPLDEVISMIRECAGAIILGIPQIVCESGSLKDQKIDNPLVLATEWNHIEAGLAHASDLPMLIIHHKGITRGIFDRGAVGKFIYEIDMQRPDWPLTDSMRGALKKWRGSLLYGANKDKQAEKNDSKESELDETEISILKLLINIDKLPAIMISRQLKLPAQRAEFHLQRLVDVGYLYDSMAVGQDNMYGLDQRGREFLFRNKLL